VAVIKHKIVHGLRLMQFKSSLQVTIVADTDSTQAQVFNDFAFVVDAALAGYNGAVLAYGEPLLDVHLCLPCELLSWR
jgi:hypothetical protein